MPRKRISKGNECSSKELASPPTPAIDDEVIKLIRGLSPQHRRTVLGNTRAYIRGIYDGASMYAERVGHAIEAKNNPELRDLYDELTASIREAADEAP